MDIKPNVACRIVQGLAEFWKCEELKDFTVTLGRVNFKCHRLVLAACSDFFRGLFRSAMKEQEQKCVTIKDISSRTFKLILEAMYTGHEVLTIGNVIKIWKAAHQLQIHFLVSECESFVIENLSLDNYVEYFQTSKALNSDVVSETVWSFILKNCHAFFQTSCFLELKVADVAALIKSQDLDSKSEDDVIDAILKWAEFQDNQPHFSSATTGGIPNTDTIYHVKDNESGSDGEPSRKKSKICPDISAFNSGLENNIPIDSSNGRRNQGCVTYQDVGRKNFTRLLSHARICLASERYLEMLANHPLVRDNKEAKEIVSDALMYQLEKRKTNGQWNTRTIHRGNSDFVYCLVGVHKIGNDVLCCAYSLTRKEWFKLPGLVNVGTIKLAAIDNKLYSLCTGLNASDLSTENTENTSVNGSTSSTAKRLFLYQLLSDAWSNVKISLTLRSDDFMVVVVDSFMYIFSEYEKKVWKLDPVAKKVRKMSNLPGHEGIAYVMSHEKWILVFYASTFEDVDETVVQCYDASENRWNQLKNIEGPANGMTSFKDDNVTYILQNNGNLRKLVKSQSDILQFELVVKLWNCNWSLKGAFVFLGDLHIGFKPENTQTDPQLMRLLPGIFTEIFYHDIKALDNLLITLFIFDKRDLNKNPLL